MANFQDCHYHAPSDGLDSQHVTSWDKFKSSLTYRGGSCLVMTSILTLSIFTLTLHSASAPQSTSLFSVVTPKSGLTASPFRNKMNNQFRSFPPSMGRSVIAHADFSQGDKAEYYSTANKGWIPCQITKVDGSGRVEINVKKGFWLDEATQEKSLRKVNPLKAFFTNSDFDFGGNVYGKGKTGRVEDALGSSDMYKEGTKAYAYARAREQRKKFAQETGRQSVFTSIVGALDFQEDIKEDRGLLKNAARMKKGDKMSREEYGALRRKVGGTGGGFFGETVEAKGAYVEKGYVPEDVGEESTPWWKRLR
eukprot:gnl/MRDRNA2_/MRDRNA2_87788_c0_seq1.p1 gnl/MRDRNA2_/MRDRNA2_87788_c0~~gnl/MRDRNA2_/MRDRNA2_87788_c0_seq1.p1  ORF type:complete len:327 (-),score=54.04 gnl/MRDRNA2_/MRDRNA2_87788_c0_seq1:277-1200(-)